MASGSRPAKTSALLAQAVAHHRAGRLDRAAALYRQILAIDPGQPDALHLSGLICHARGDSGEGLRRIGAAIARAPRQAGYRNSEGVVRLEMGDAAGAEAAFRTALALDPGLAEAANNLGNALQRAGRLAEAVAAYDHALSLRPDYAEAHANRGRALHRLGKTAAAIADLERAIQLRPNYGRAHRYLGDALGEAGERAAAEHHYRAALAVDARDAEALAGRAGLAERAGRLEEAIAFAEQALTAAPATLRASLIAARCERRLGRAADALRRLERVATDGAEAELAAAYAFEVGACCDTLGAYERAFAAFSEGNARLAATPAAQSLDQEAFPRLIARLKARFTPDWLASFTPPPPAASGEPPDPVFLIGFPRSGTTLLDQILDAHPALTVLAEKPAVDAVRAEVESLPGGYPDALATLSPAALTALRRRYWRAAQAALGAVPSGRLVDKMPLNTIDVGLIWRLFPRATFLLALRHPCDVVLSNFMQAFQPNAAMIHFATLDGSARFYAMVMDLWQHYQRLLPLSVVVSRYEDLTLDPEGQTRRLLAALGVAWDERVLAYAEHARARTIATPSYHQVVQPIYRRAVGRWHHYARQMAPVLPVLAPFLGAFGYGEPGRD